MLDSLVMNTVATRLRALIAGLAGLDSKRRIIAELQKRNEDLEAFAHTAAHDLRSPLNLMVGYASELQSDSAAVLDAEQREQLDVIVRSGLRLSNLVEDLLKLAETHQTDVPIGRVDMASVVMESIEQLAQVIEAKSPEIMMPARWPSALGYAPWVRQVWVNLMSNALKYGGNPPRLELGTELQSNGMVRFWVRDNGPGIAPEDQSRLFSPFQRLDKDRAKGHGLGLAIVRNIVEKLGGYVDLESKVGCGSIFSFTLPKCTDQGCQGFIPVPDLPSER